MELSLTKKQLNSLTNTLGTVLASIGIMGDSIPLDSIIAWAYSLNPTVVALAFGV